MRLDPNFILNCQSHMFTKAPVDANLHINVKKHKGKFVFFSEWTIEIVYGDTLYVY